MTLQPANIELLALLFLPLATAIVVACLGSGRAHTVRYIALFTSLVCLYLSLQLALRLRLEQQTENPPLPPAQKLPTFRPAFVPGSPVVTPDNKTNKHATTWDLVTLDKGSIQFYIGVDGLNIWMIVLTAFLMLPCVLVSWTAVTDRPHEFYAWLMVLQTAMLGIFMSFDIILFYVFFELSLVPLFFLIGIWGGAHRQFAARKFFVFTLTGSLITLLGMIGVILECYQASGGKELTFSIPRLVELVHEQIEIGKTNDAVRAHWQTVQLWVFVALSFGLAIKVPLFPLHTWLPLAHTEAPTAGSVDLAGVLLKVGAYGFLRLCIPLAPDVSLSHGLPVLSALAAIGIVYGAFCAYAQDDVKKMIAYSSVSHLGVCMLGMFSFTVMGLAGALMVMINHGLSTAGLFLLIGMLYERYHTRKIADYGGMASRLPLLGFFMVFICFSSVGLPGLNGFIGEVLVLLGVMQRNPIYAAIGVTGVVWGAWYLFTMVRSVFFGPVKEPEVHDHKPITDLTSRELAVIVPIVLLCIVIGLYPQPLLDTAEPDLAIIADVARRAEDRAKQVSTAQVGANAIASADQPADGEDP